MASWLRLRSLSVLPASPARQNQNQVHSFEKVGRGGIHNYLFTV